MGYEAGDANLYRYCSNSPVSFTDKEGLEKCCPGTCDTWYIQVFSVISGIAVGGVTQVEASLSADSKTCDMPLGSAPQGDYKFLGGSLGIGLELSAAVGSLGERRIFTTDCISYDDHVGSGRVTAVGIGAVVTYGILYLTTPQTYQLVGGFSWGVDVTLATSVGHWWFQ